MAKKAIINAVVYIGGQNVSDWLSKIEDDGAYDEVETTTYGDNGEKTYVGGLHGGTISMDFKQDYAPAAINDIMSGLVSREPVTMSWKPFDAAVSSANKLHEGKILLNSWQPISGNVGELPTVSKTFQKSGAWTVTTTG
jgi:hypothetical protein